MSPAFVPGQEFLRTQEARTYEALDLAITQALDAIAPEDYVGWFIHVCYYQSSH